MAALLSADSGDNERIAKAVEECRVMGLPVLAPDVNESFEDFGVTAAETRADDTIRFGLRTIKNFGDSLATTIVDERKANGKYESLEDFLLRVNGRDLNKKSLEALALAGGLDSLEDRSLIIGNLDDLLGFAKSQREQNKAQDSLFSMMGTDQAQSHLNLLAVEGKTIRVKTTGMEFEVVNELPLSKKDKLFWEKQLLGLYVSGHPIGKKNQQKIISMGMDVRTTKNAASGIRKVIGIVDAVKEIQTKKGDTMAFVSFSDTHESIELVVFPNAYKEYRDLLNGDGILQVVGKLNRRDGEVSLLMDKAKRL